MLDAGRMARVALESCRLFSGLPEAELVMLTRQAALERYRAGDILFRHDDPVERFFVVVEGRVALCLDADGEDASVARIAGPGDTFAEACICGLGTYSVTAEALTPAMVITIPRAPLRALLEERFDLVLPMLCEMSFRLRNLVRQITELKMKTAAQRLASCLLRLTEVEKGPAEIHLPYGKKMLASQLGMMPETLSRAFMKLQALGLHGVARGNVMQIKEVTVLREFAADAEQDS